MARAGAGEASMRSIGTSAAARRRFTRFDVELADSDRTLGGAARPAGLRLGVGRRRPYQESAFFTETTDDDELSFGRAPPPTLPERRTYTRTAPDRRSPLFGATTTDPQDSATKRYSRVVVGSIDFPATRSVLWGRRALADPVSVSPGLTLPRFVVSADAARKIYHLYQRQIAVADVASSSGSPACFLHGVPLVPSQKTVKLTDVVDNEDAARTVNSGWKVPVFFRDDTDKAFSQDDYVGAITTAQNSYSDEYCESLAAHFQPRLVVSAIPDIPAQLDFQIEFPFAPLLLKFSLIRNLPLLMTPLASSLARREFGRGEEGARRSGYLTLDRTRKAVPLLKVDPLVYQQPIVGVWVYGVDLDDEWDQETVRTQLADPFLYFACLHYLTSRAIKERVQLAKNTFLVALYPSSDTVNGRAVSPLPRFFECSFSEHADLDAFLPMELCAHRKSSLAGSSKFSTDIELVPVVSTNAAWESAKRKLNIPVVPQQPKHAPASPTAAEEAATAAFDASHSSFEGSLPEDFEDLSRSVNSSRWSTVEDVRAAVENKATDDAHRSSKRQPTESAKRETNPTSAEKEEEPAEARGVTAAVDAPAVTTTTQPPLEESDKESQVMSPKTTTTRAEQTAIPRREERSDVYPFEPANYRSCCKSQQLLSLQHQQILENQQRQLQEMQEQIVQLRLLLEETRVKSDADRSLRRSGVDSVGSRKERRWSQVGSELSRLSASLRSMDRLNRSGELLSPRPQGDDDAASEGKSSLSSLGFSSVSNGSIASDDLSSLSSSFTPSRFKKSARPRKEAQDVLSSSQTSVHDSPASVHNEDVGGEGTLVSDPVVEASPQVRDAENQGPSTNAEQTEAHERAAESEGVEDVPVDISDLHQAHSPAVELATAVIVSPSTKPNAAVSDEDDDNYDSDDVDDVDTSHVFQPSLHLLLPDAYLKQKGPLVDHHGGCYTTPTPDLHSFCVPRIKFAPVESPVLGGSDSEDDEMRLIEQKYRKLMAAKVVHTDSFQRSSLTY